MSQPTVKSGVQPRGAILEQGKARGTGPQAKGTAQEGGAGRESRGVRGGGRAEGTGRQARETNGTE